MRLPFSLESFLDVFRQYHAAIGIAPILLMAMAVAMLVVAHSSAPWRHRAVNAGLATLWLWAGVVYHWTFFARINPAARLFAIVFVAQAMLLLWTGVVRARLEFQPRGDWSSLAGWVLVAYALVVYPLAGMAAGHGYPGGPSFGAPCPMVIFTIGVLFWTAGRLPLVVVVIPVIWAAIGTSAAIQLGITEDFGLPVAAIALLARRFAARRVAEAR